MTTGSRPARVIDLLAIVDHGVEGLGVACPRLRVRHGLHCHLRTKNCTSEGRSCDGEQGLQVGLPHLLVVRHRCCGAQRLQAARLVQLAQGGSGPRRRPGRTAARRRRRRSRPGSCRPDHRQPVPVRQRDVLRRRRGAVEQHERVRRGEQVGDARRLVAGADRPGRAGRAGRRGRRGRRRRGRPRRQPSAARRGARSAPAAARRRPCSGGPCRRRETAPYSGRPGRAGPSGRCGGSAATVTRRSVRAASAALRVGVHDYAGVHGAHQQRGEQTVWPPLVAVRRSRRSRRPGHRAGPLARSSRARGPAGSCSGRRPPGRTAPRGAHRHPPSRLRHETVRARPGTQCPPAR